MVDHLVRHRAITRDVAHLDPKEIHVEQRSRAWFMQRRGRITGSNLAAAAGLSPYKSRRRLWQELTGRVEVPDISGKPALRWGTHHEPHALAAYEAVTGFWGVQEPGMVLDAMDTWLAVSPDGWAGPRSVTDPERGAIYLEVKCPYSKALYEDIPSYYMPQVQGGLGITRRRVAHFMAYVPRLEEEDLVTGKMVEVEPESICVWQVRHSEAYEAHLRHHLREFMRHVVDHTDPGRSKRPKMPDVEYEELYRGPVASAPQDLGARALAWAGLDADDSVDGPGDHRGDGADL